MRSFKLIIATTLVFWIFYSPLAWSASLDKSDIEQKLKEKKASHKELLSKEKKLGSEVGDLKKNLVSLSEDLRTIEGSLSANDKKIESLEKEHQQYLDQMYKDYESIGSLVVAAQRFKKLSTSELMLQQTPLNSARTSLVMKSIIPDLDKRAANLRQSIEEIEKIEKNIYVQKELKSKELIKFNQKQESLSKLLKERKALYEKTALDRKAQEDEMKKLAREAKNLEELVLKIEPKSKKPSSTKRFEMPANALLPVHGAIITGFGENDDLGAKSKGIIFKTAPESPVVTPLAGIVKFAGPFQKYKEILIIQHDGGYHSLIAGLGRVDTVVGASLDAGEPVGRTDSTSDNSSIYYELRQNGSAVNPQKLLIAQRKKNKS